VLEAHRTPGNVNVDVAVFFWQVLYALAMFVFNFHHRGCSPNHTGDRQDSFKEKL
jgi:hypothetical protein